MRYFINSSRIFIFIILSCLFISHTCLAETAIIPGYAGSGVWCVADLSSAVFKPSYYSETIVAVCVKEESRSGDVSNRGVWYFMQNSNGFIYVKTNDSNSYKELYGPYHSDFKEWKQEFFKKLVLAAKYN